VGWIFLAEDINESFYEDNDEISGFMKLGCVSLPE
jgi:hypothetical protein